MESLLIGGAPSVGKSEAIYRLTNRLTSKGFRVVAGSIPKSFDDFMVVIEGVNQNNEKVRIIINSATDTVDIIIDFKTFFDINGKYDILISSIRDNNFWPRQDFFKIMGINENQNLIEIPMGKITRRKGNFSIALNWYKNKMDRLIDNILSNNPFGI